jgi:hypothetical protein
VKVTCTWSEGSAYRYVKVTTELDPNYCDHVYTVETVAPTSPLLLHSAAIR